MMLLAVYVSLIVLTPNYATSHCSFGTSKFGAERNQKEEVIDMDSLMDTLYPRRPTNQLTNEAHDDLSAMKSKPQYKPKTPSRDFESVLLPESGTGERVFGNLRVVQDNSSTRTTENVETEIPGVSLEPNTIPPLLRKLFLDHKSNVTKRGSLSNVNLLHRSRKCQRANWADQSISFSFGSNVLAPKIIPPLLQSLKDSKDRHYLTPFCKRSAGKENESQKQLSTKTKPEEQVRQSREVKGQEKLKWAEWHSIGNLKTVQKRDANSRRMRISDIWNKPKKGSNHEEAVKIVLPLLLSDMKESKEANKPIAMFASKGPGTARVHNPVGGTTAMSSEHLAMKNLRVKGEDGKEYSFSASISDVQQLLGLLAKPDSTLMLEKVSPDKCKQEKVEKSSTSPSKKVTAHVSVTPKLVEKSFLASCTESTDIPEMKEIETDVLENVVQMDIPCNKTGTTTVTDNGTTRCPDGETSSGAGGILDAE